jgi:hypothetical protein
MEQRQLSADQSFDVSNVHDVRPVHTDEVTLRKNPLTVSHRFSQDDVRSIGEDYSDVASLTLDPNHIGGGMQVHSIGHSQGYHIMLAYSKVRLGSIAYRWFMHCLCGTWHGDD